MFLCLEFWIHGLSQKFWNSLSVFVYFLVILYVLKPPLAIWDQYCKSHMKLLRFFIIFIVQIKVSVFTCKNEKKNIFLYFLLPTIFRIILIYYNTQPIHKHKFLFFHTHLQNTIVSFDIVCYVLPPPYFMWLLLV